MACGTFGGVALTGCRKASSPPPPGHKISGSPMGTYCRVTWPTRPPGISEADLRITIVTQLDRIDALMSTYKTDSEVSRFNRSRDTAWFPVSEETATVVVAALQVFEESNGAFDITVAPLVELWGFGRRDREGGVPSPTEIQELLQTIGSQHLQARLSPPALKKDQESLQIDLSAIAKGFAVDSVARSLDDLGITNYLVDIGGEMRARGHKEQEVPWNIAIERPTALQRGIQTTLPLQDIAIATSGDYRNYFEADGKRYSHEIDPRSGQPIQHRLVSVSVLDASCMRADAWATALIILGPEEGTRLAEQASLPTFLIVKDGSNFQEIEVSGFAALTPSP